MLCREVSGYITIKPDICVSAGPPYADNAGDIPTAMKNGIIVENDKAVSISALHQWPTYGGLLEGIPTDRVNARILERLSGEIKRHCGNKSSYILQPEQTPIAYEGHYPFGTPMALPAMICVADLVYSQPVRDPDQHGSQLAVAWFQEEYAFPIDEEIMHRFRELKWSALAEDFYY